MTTQTAPVETIEVEGASLLTKVTEVAHDGSVRRIRILYEDEDPDRRNTPNMTGG